MTTQLPKKGWLTHTEQTQPDAGEFWHMKTVLENAVEVTSVDTTICPPEMIKRLAGRRPPFLTVLMHHEVPVHFEPADDSETAYQNHFNMVRDAVRGLDAFRTAFPQRKEGKA